MHMRPTFESSYEAQIESDSRHFGRSVCIRCGALRVCTSVGRSAPTSVRFVGASEDRPHQKRETRMTKNRVKTAPKRLRRTLSLAATAALAVACGSGGKAPAPSPEPKDEGPFKS